MACRTEEVGLVAFLFEGIFERLSGPAESGLFGLDGVEYIGFFFLVACRTEDVGLVAFLADAVFCVTGSADGVATLDGVKAFPFLPCHIISSSSFASES